jgi:type I restriction-modification system DNA methylase subunit
MSEELRQKGYLKNGKAHGDAVGPYEGFNLGATTLEQLRQCGIVPDQSYGKHSKRKPDGLVVDRRSGVPIVRFVAEFKNVGGLNSHQRTVDFSEKVADEYCRPLGCEFGGISDTERNSWLLVTPEKWQPILREDAYPLDYPIDLANNDGRRLIGRTLLRLETNLNKPRAHLEPLEAVNPTRLAEQTWQDIWLACGEQPEACLATFIELLIFKFLSDLGVLRSSPSGAPINFETVAVKSNDQILKYYFDIVRPEIRRLFPAGEDGTSVINGIVLSPKGHDQGKLFRQILQRFEDFGSLKRIDPEFKSRIFERFLKKSLSVKNWGQYFTARNVVKAMVEMSGIEHLPPGAVSADPACGVGGFVLEPLMNKRPYDYRSPHAKGLSYLGWDRDEKTIILAKANMLIHLSETIEQDPVGAVTYLSSALNSTFHSVSHSLTGSLQLAPRDKFDLLMTNIPYVTRGTGKQREFLESFADYYSIPGSGVENLFLQLIINGLKPGCRALVIVPDGLLMRHSEDALRAHILRTCVLEAIVSLPVNTFYSTPKKTYILVIRKKQRPDSREQAQPVFSYLIGNIGETLDAKRFVISENDLPQMASLFKLFQGNPSEFKTDDPRCKLFPASQFKPEEHWLVNKWWSLEERERLGDIEAECFISPGELSGILHDASDTLDNQAKAVVKIERKIPIERTVTISLSDKRYFRMSIGKRVLKKELFHAERGSIPLYSANVEPGKEHGWVKESNITDFSHPSLLWSIDSDFNISVRKAGEVFATTDHCGRLEILDPNLDPFYCQAAIVYGYGRTYGFDRVMRPSIRRMENVTLRVPVKADFSFDIESQKELGNEFLAVQEAVAVASDSLGSIKELKPKSDIPGTAKDFSLEEQFRQLADQWKKETGMLSVLEKKISHPAYQRIVRMGAEALPIILRELEMKREHWLWALKEITGKDVVKPGASFDEAVDAWLKWGRQSKYL